MAPDRDAAENYILHLVSIGQLEGASERLRQLLSEDPNDPWSHAMLALVMLDMRRLHAARAEAQQAMAFGPEEPLSLTASCQVLLAERRFKDAEKVARHYQALEPHSPGPLGLLASALRLQHRPDEARTVLLQALEFDPQSVETLTNLAEVALERRDWQGAEQYIGEALRIQPDEASALVLRGRLLLRNGRLDEATDHARWVLSNDATHRGALHLLCAIKARRSPLTGLWWRFNNRLGEMGEAGTLIVLIGLYLIFRFCHQGVEDLGYPQAQDPLLLAWLLLCVYTWVSPWLFRRAIAREMESVQLKKSF